ncbi:hypothetical protein DASC09_011150 [Saccharomycopsis crataegensis]|uniref:Uncharacterized protein n=1 Tax=Saccharomycopsis crataegensis TaxID=43959 RepID=A0AAV5QFR5_9ASCO|nr:hypothetical protein DASC09_011150 [Saccharomycopsis crataegensis]
MTIVPKNRPRSSSRPPSRTIPNSITSPWSISRCSRVLRPFESRLNIYRSKFSRHSSVANITSSNFEDISALFKIVGIDLESQSEESDEEIPILQHKLSILRRSREIIPDNESGDNYGPSESEGDNSDSDYNDEDYADNENSEDEKYESCKKVINLEPSAKYNHATTKILKINDPGDYDWLMMRKNIPDKFYEPLSEIYTEFKVLMTKLGSSQEPQVLRSFSESTSIKIGISMILNEKNKSTRAEGKGSDENRSTEDYPTFEDIDSEDSDSGAGQLKNNGRFISNKQLVFENRSQWYHLLQGMQPQYFKWIIVGEIIGLVIKNFENVKHLMPILIKFCSKYEYRYMQRYLIKVYLESIEESEFWDQVVNAHEPCQGAWSSGKRINEWVKYDDNDIIIGGYKPESYYVIIKYLAIKKLYLSTFMRSELFVIIEKSVDVLNRGTKQLENIGNIFKILSQLIYCSLTVFNSLGNEYTNIDEMVPKTINFAFRKVLKTLNLIMNKINNYGMTGQYLSFLEDVKEIMRNQLESPPKSQHIAIQVRKNCGSWFRVLSVMRSTISSHSLPKIPKTQVFKVVKCLKMFASDEFLQMVIDQSPDHPLVWQLTGGSERWVDRKHDNRTCTAPLMKSRVNCQIIKPLRKNGSLSSLIGGSSDSGSSDSIRLLVGNSSGKIVSSRKKRRVRQITGGII